MITFCQSAFFLGYFIRVQRYLKCKKHTLKRIRIILDVGTREGNRLAMLSNYSEQRREYIGVGIDLRGRSTIDPRVSENHILRCPSTLFQCEGNLN